jgi:hypothetical protein
MSIEELVRDLKSLTLEQLDHLASMVHGFSLRGRQQEESLAPVAIPQSMVDDAVRHHWPQELFTKFIGSLPELERAPQPAYDVRKTS